MGLSKGRFWDIWVVRQDGDWLAFRSPEGSLRRVTGFFGILLLVGLLACVGWLVSRWQVENLESQLAQAQLALRSSKVPIPQGEAKAGGVASASGNTSWMPALDGSLQDSGLARFEEVSVSFDLRKSELSMRFDVVRNQPTDGPLKLYFVLIVQGPQGIVAHPPVLATRVGDLVSFQKGRLLEGLQTRRSFAEAFRLTGFMERSPTDPVFATFLLYDTQGSLVARTRLEVPRLGDSGL
jgi:hypothetical protein